MWKQFFDKLAELRATNEPFAVGTVVKVSGSTYRRPGARVLITQDGSATGLISGGCFESDLMERAKKVIQEQTAVTLSFDTTSPDDLIFGLGLGCTGVAHILLEPFQGEHGQEHLDFIADCVRNRKEGVLVTVFQSQNPKGTPVGAHIMFGRDHHDYDNISNSDVQSALLDECRKALDSGATHIYTLPGQITALIELIALPVPLVIFGAGPDAAPLARFAKNLGWTVTVVDRRPAFARPDRFPSADAVLLCEPKDLAQNVKLDANTAAVIMTHHFETDWQYLKEVLDSTVSYIGLLGPKAKSELLLQTVRENGFVPTEEQLSRIYAPVGLDIGAESPEEIALSIIAEIQAIQAAHPAGFLRERLRPIHDS